MDKRILEQEKQHLIFILSIIEKSLKSLKKINQEVIDKTVELKTYMNSMVLKEDEIVEIYQRVDELYTYVEQNLGQIQKDEKSLNSPYFGKIIFSEKENERTQYIGLNDISDENGNYIVSDWRSPVSSLFYYAKLGKAEYNSPLGELSVDLKLRRQLVIENGELNYYCDTTNKIDDTLLLELLSKDASSKMANIAQSIQFEQDQIIRQPIYNNLIVNGIAGSGKTSIGMHRIAYLLYANKEIIKHNNILVLSPNELFSEYIDTLLPELGERNVEALPFCRYLLIYFPNFRNSELRSKMFEDILVNNPTRLELVQKKFTYDYLEKLQEYLGSINIEGIIGTVMIGKRKIDVASLKKQYVMTENNNFRIYKKIEYIIDAIIDKYFMRAPAQKIDYLKDEMKKLFTKKIYATKPFLKFFQTIPQKLTLVDGKLPYDYIPTIAFIEFAIKGFPQNHNIKQLFLDEMQDYDAVSLKIIRELFPKCTFTFVGDQYQNLIGSSSNSQTIEKIFNLTKKFELNNCYRSTYEIMSFANEIVGKDYNPTLIRHGNEVLIEQTEIKQATIDDILSKLSQKKTAIVCKTEKEAVETAKKLPDWNLIIEETNNKQFFNSDKIITTVYLAKGLEFDNVIIPNFSTDNYNTQADKQILYVSATRALHNLVCLYENNKYIIKK